MGDQYQHKLTDLAARLRPLILNMVETASAVTGGGGGHTIQDEGVNLTARSKLNFIGSGVTAADNNSTGATDVNIPAPAFYPTFVPVIANSTGTAYYPISGVELLNNLTRTAGGAIFQVPAGWSGTLTVSAIIEVGGSSSGDLYIQISWQRAAVNGVIDSVVGADTAVAIAGGSNGKLLSVHPTEITDAAAGDIVDLMFKRSASSSSDTYENDINIRGFLIDWG
jgi:hypothetical protein